MDNKTKKHVNSDKLRADSDQWGYVVCVGTVICFVSNCIVYVTVNHLKDVL